MSKIKIKFKGSGKWGDEPSKPVFDVEAGEELMVTHAFAETAVGAGKATYVVDTSAADLAEKEAADKEAADKEAADKEAADKEAADKEAADKEAADKEAAVSFDAPAAGPKLKAEGKKKGKGK